MHFLTIVSLLSTAALAVPQTTCCETETVSIDNFFLGKSSSSGPITKVSFTLYSADEDAAGGVQCESTDESLNNLDGTVYGCGDSKYRFGLINGEDTRYGLRLYHELGTAAGVWGEVDVLCNGPIPMICEQVGNITATLSWNGQA